MIVCIYNGAAEMVTEGRIQVELHHDSIPPLEETYDLCYILSLAAISCPLMSGELRFGSV